jgi:hypothetical protein
MDEPQSPAGREGCPKCGYMAQPVDAAPPGECPRCGVIYSKYRERQARFAAGTLLVEAPGLPPTADAPESAGSWREQLWAAMWQEPEQDEPLRLYGHSLVLLGSLIWGLWFILQPIDGEIINGSFLHRADLPFHEFGHVLFRPFGEWLMFLGGSLFQCLLPLLLAGYFLLRQGQPFAASVCLWWCGQNFIDIAPYIGDARAMALPLVGEWTDEAVEMRDLRHDWHNILLPLHWLPYDHRIAVMAKVIGSGLMLLSWVWGWLLLWRQLRRRL